MTKTTSKLRYGINRGSLAVLKCIIRLLVLPENARLGGKCLAMTNVLAYCTELITSIKGFIVPTQYPMAYCGHPTTLDANIRLKWKSLTVTDAPSLQRHIIN